MNGSNKFSPQVRERAVRLVQEHRDEYHPYGRQWNRLHPKIGCVATTLLDWVKRAEIDEGKREGVTRPW